MEVWQKNRQALRAYRAVRDCWLRQRIIPIAVGVAIGIVAAVTFISNYL